MFGKKNEILSRVQKNQDQRKEIFKKRRLDLAWHITDGLLKTLPVERWKMTELIESWQPDCSGLQSKQEMML